MKALVSWPWPYLPLFALSRPIYIIPEPSESSLSTQCQSWTLWPHPEPTRVLAMHSRTLWLPCVSLTHSRPDAPSTFPLPRIKSIPDIHTHSRPDTIQPSLFLHQVYSQHFISLTTAVGQSLIVYLPCSICPSLFFLALYISVSLLSTVCSSVSSFATLCSFLYVSSSVPHLHLSSFHLSLFYPSVNPTLLFCTYLTTHSRSFRSTQSLPHPALV